MFRAKISRDVATSTAAIPPADVPLTESDLEQMRFLGIERAALAEQWRLLKKGKHYLKLVRPCESWEGVVVLSDGDVSRFVSLYDNKRLEGVTALKFVPASGAATRMFAEWQTSLDVGKWDKEGVAEKFLRDLPNYPFYPLLGEYLGKQSIFQLQQSKNISALLDAILSTTGLRYADVPKALVPFHRYGGLIVTPLEEHLLEAAHYCADAAGECRVHFTIAAEHEERVRVFLEEVKSDYERTLNVRFHVDFSRQAPESNTIALDENGDLARSPDGKLLFRPGGHGALLSNLQRLRADVIFIKNIDNVAHSSRIATTIRYKKALAGYLLFLLAERDKHLQNLRTDANSANIAAAASFCMVRLNRGFGASFLDLPIEEIVSLLLQALSRPLRVCGMVRNQGEPGGAPFWVREGDRCYPQIVESFQVDTGNAGQESLWKSAKYFNPVDIVCSISDATGAAFDLSQFVDSAAVSLSEKREGDKNLTVLEWPGLWNGSMAGWNSAFVEVPIETFNPVKTVTDLLRKGHREDHRTICSTYR